MDIRILEYSTVEKAYMNVVLDHSEMIGLATGLGLIFAIFNIIREAKKASERTIDVAMILGLIKEYAGVLAMILFLPVALSLFEEIFSIIEKSYMGQMGNAPDNKILEACKNEVNNYSTEHLNNLNLFSLGDWFKIIILGLDYIGVMLIKPFIILIDNWSFGFALIYRFIFLGVLKMVGGLALACYIYEGTRSIYISYIKNLCVCYLLIPGFLFVTVFVDAIRDLFANTDQIQIGVVFMSVFLKIFGYGAVTKLLHQSI
jgi:hypothetical protein